ncbi:MAG: ATP-binding protein [Fibrobacter sp.]|nr:ATP-binding protein [Fibrobacter sp.]
MTSTKALLQFKTRARLLAQLGEQLIKDEAIALVELVKNAYDADARCCNVILEKLDVEGQSSILIEDDGCGMNYDTIKNVWLEIGTSNKFDKKKAGKKTPVLGRSVLGEKGIGRFGAHRLGECIEIITRAKDCQECVLTIDWSSLDKVKYIEDIPISLLERPPKHFRHKTGTCIKITKLKDKWERGKVRSIARSINSLNSPYCSEDSFSVSISVSNDWLSNILSYEDVKGMSMYSFDLTMNGGQITSFSYDFKPYTTMNNVEGRHVSLDQLAATTIIDSNNNKIDLEKSKVGSIRIEGRIFDLETRILSLGLTSGASDVKEYLRNNGGVRVFRDNMRVWDYGEVGNDWLGLDARRINDPSRTISNRLLLAAVYLNGDKSDGLVEKANREGFVDNAAFKIFQDACRFAILNVEVLRNSDKDRIREVYKKDPQPGKNVSESIEDLRTILKKKIKDEKLLHSLNQKLDLISDNYSRTVENLMKSAGAGLNLTSVLHQVEKIVKNLKYNLTKNVELDAVVSDMSLLSDLVEGYSVLTRNSRVKERDVVPLLAQGKKNVRLRLNAHRITFVMSESCVAKTYYGLYSDNLLMNVVMNIVDNSIWWLCYKDVENPEIYVDVRYKGESYLSVVFADNGPGFALGKDELTKPFVSAKPAGLGMGIGLHLSKEIMESMGGEILFPDYKDVDVPEKYCCGAIVELLLKRKK